MSLEYNTEDIFDKLPLFCCLKKKRLKKKTREVPEQDNQAPKRLIILLLKCTVVKPNNKLIARQMQS